MDAATLEALQAALVQQQPQVAPDTGGIDVSSIPGGMATLEALQAALMMQQQQQAVQTTTMQAGAMAGKLFLGGLAQHTTNESLSAYFSQYGPCDCNVMVDRGTGRSRGFGFCTFGDASSAQQVLQSASHQVDGKTIECKLCQPKGHAPPSILPPSRAAASGTGYGYSGMPPQPSPQAVAQAAAQAAGPLSGNKVFVGGLPQTCDDAKLQAFFGQFGAMSECRVMMDKNTGRSRGFAFVHFQAEDSVRLAIASSPTAIIDDKKIEIRPCQEKPPEGRPPGGMDQNSLNARAFLEQQQQRAQVQAPPPPPAAVGGEGALDVAALVQQQLLQQQVQLLQAQQQQLVEQAAFETQLEAQEASQGLPQLTDQSQQLESQAASELTKLLSSDASGLGSLLSPEAKARLLQQASSAAQGSTRPGPY